MSDTEHDGAAEIGGSGGGGGAAAGGAGGPAKALSPAVEGVLLYYGYRDLRSCRGEVAAWIEALSTQLGLVGRIRVALDGLNATLGGTLGALRTHAAAVEARFGSAKQGPAIDFKLAASHGRASAAAAAGSAFDRLTVQQVTEVVSLGVLDWLPQPRREDDGSGTCSSCDVSGDVAGLLPAGARHVEPAEFHALLAAAAAGRSHVGPAFLCFPRAVVPLGGTSSQALVRPLSGFGCTSALMVGCPSTGAAGPPSACTWRSLACACCRPFVCSFIFILYLVDAGQPGGKAPVLIDARNLYETAIGRFKAVSARWGEEACVACGERGGPMLGSSGLPWLLLLLLLVRLHAPIPSSSSSAVPAARCGAHGPSSALLLRHAAVAGGQPAPPGRAAHPDVLHRGREVSSVLV